MFSVFMYHTLTYYYVNNEHERRIFISQFTKAAILDFHGNFQLKG